MYKTASKLKLRFNTTKGLLNSEQLWDLNSVELSNAIKAVKKILKKNDDDDLSFLEESKTVDVENQLKFDILKDVYLTKKKESDDARDAHLKKEHNQKIIEIIAKKQYNDLENNTSIDELYKMLK